MNSDYRWWRAAKRGVWLFWGILFSLPVQAQDAPKKVTYFAHIEPIVRTNCAPCHQPGKAGPFSLLTYEDVAKRAKFIAHVTQTRYMPPWHADPEFRHFANERVLTNEQIALIQKWVQTGMPAGRKRRETPVPTGPYPARKPDLTVRMNRPFNIPSDNSEQFRFFHLPTNLPENSYVEAIEFIPGNHAAVHHSRVMADTTNAISGIDGLSEDDPKAKDFQAKPLADAFMYGWVPGNFPVFFPAGTAKKLRANTDIILNVHYAPSPIPLTDQSAVNFYFAKGPVGREVQTLTMNENFITNQPFMLKAEAKPTFYMHTARLPEAVSLISVMPHMHRLGKTFLSYAITPTDEVIPLIKIPAWDFNWQTTYQFDTLVHLPKGTIIFAEATYDNTAQNPENPHRPPKDITYGWGTKDEMMNLIFYYVKHQPGDEKITATKK